MEKFKFKIENEMHDWPSQFITGAEVRGIPPGIPSNMDLFVKIKGKPGQLVANDQKIDLENQGLEKFYSQDSNSTPGA